MNPQIDKLFTLGLFMTVIEASAHCDGPCGVYDPASARVAAEAVQSMTKKMMALEANHLLIVVLPLTSTQ